MLPSGSVGVSAAEAVQYSCQHVILHVPHSGIDTPEEYLGPILVSEDALRLNIFKEVDMYVDHLFMVEHVRMLRPSFCRQVCDVERFRSDDDESESRRGRGVFYTHFENGIQFREDSPPLKQRILKELYDPHHQAFTLAVEGRLQEYGLCQIIDCHSFSDAPEHPGFCIGIDSFHTPESLWKCLQNFIEQAGYEVRVNFPYSGSIVSMAHYQKDRRVSSIMIEVNKRLYMDETTLQKKDCFGELSQYCRSMIALIAAAG